MKERNKQSRMSLFFAVLGWMCILYFLCIVLFAGYGTLFFVVWLVAGAAALLFSFCLRRGIWQKHVPLWVRRGFWCIAAVGTAVFVVAECFILSGFAAKASENADYLIVLGAQVKPNGPSRVLQYRLDAAIDYLEAHPDCKVIVSGGQGTDEVISEAQGMHDYLAAQGIEADRIQMEDQSVNTIQNLLYSARYLDKEKDDVVIVTNNFHVFRAVGIAKKQGYQHVSGLSADGNLFFLPNNMLREFIGLFQAVVL